MKSRLLAVTLATANFISLTACGPADPVQPDGSGGSTGTASGGASVASGGQVGTGSGGAGVAGGGSVATGGSPGSGGLVASGGQTGAGGTGGGSGGSVGTGGGIGSGGRGGTAGNVATGGSVGTGGAGGRGGTGGVGGSGMAGVGGSGTGGSVGTGGVSGSGGASVACTARAGTSTRPQLTSTTAANFTIARYFASPDNWDPTAGLGAAGSFTANFTVAADGSGTHTTVQAALTAAATGTARRYVLVRPGTYPEVVSIAGSTPITLYGADTDATRVTIVSGRSAADAGGTGQSATFTTRAAGFQLMNLTISNNFATPASGTNIQAVALLTTGDKTVLENVRLHGFQDTLYVDSPSATAIARVYIKNSFIEGDTDFIFGRAVMVIDGGTIRYLSSRRGTSAGVIFAPSTHVDNMYGFLVTKVNFTAEASAPANRISLGRSWDQSSTTPTPNGQVVIRESTLGGHIAQTAPWAAAATSGRAYSATGNRFNEYCNSGAGAGP